MSARTPSVAGMYARDIAAAVEYVYEDHMVYPLAWIIVKFIVIFMPRTFRGMAEEAQRAG